MCYNKYSESEVIQMTDFRKDVKNFLDLLNMGTIEKIEISVDSAHYVIKTEEETFLYDLTTEEEIL